jgi:hypothetical protein
MFVFAEIKKEYQYHNSEGQIFERLNDLTYEGRGRTLKGHFICNDPPTFELYHPHEMMQSSKPFATKVTVTLTKQGGNDLLSIKTTTNPTYVIFSILLVLSFVVQIVGQPSLKTVAIYLVSLTMLLVWDRQAKRTTLKRLERLLS